jgi:predicted DNA-binding protein (MmcQ/YjbR family)
MIEEEIFKRCIIEEDKLIQYGFYKEKDTYFYHKDILNHEFEVIIEIKNNKVKGKIIEKELNEEYINYRIENQIGEFVSSIKEEFIEILKDIKLHCTKENIFVYPQANRITNWIKDKYQDPPEFLWDDGVNGVFRNKDNKKWYGIIMYINQSKLEPGDKKIEVMNVKLPPEQIDELVKQEGFFRAYHMNKKYWITFKLDDTIKDEVLKELIDISYQFTIKTK